MKTHIGILSKTHISLCFIFFIFYSIALTGQNYKSVHFDREAYFESESFFVEEEDGLSPCSPCRFGIRVDSLLSSSNQYVFPAYNSRIFCSASPRASWLGDTLTLLPDGTEQFRNKAAGTITIKTQAEPGDSWLMFDLNGSNYLEASVVDKVYEEALGVMDSIKTFSISAKDMNGDSIDHEMNGFIFRIGKLSGFVEAFDMYHFPERLNPMFLIGMNEPEIGEQLLDKASIFDFNVGDERHYYQYLSSFSSQSNTNTRYIILNRDNNPDNVIYTMERYLVHISSFYDYDLETNVTSVNSLLDTITRIYDLEIDDIINRHPYEYRDDDSFSHIGKDSENEWVKYTLSTACLTETVDKDYKVCLGLTHDYYRASGQNTGKDEDLVYYKKDSVEWGIPIDFETLVNTEEIQDPSNQISIFPNPTSESITIENKDRTIEINNIQVYNSTGQKIANWEVGNQSYFTKSVADFSKGVYWLVLADSDGAFWRLSFVRM